MLLSHLVVSDSATPWAVVRQAPLSMGVLQARILEWLAMPSSRGFSQSGIASRSPALQADSFYLSQPGLPSKEDITKASL